MTDAQWNAIQPGSSLLVLSAGVQFPRVLQTVEVVQRYADFVQVTRTWRRFGFLDMVRQTYVVPHYEVVEVVSGAGTA